MKCKRCQKELPVGIQSHCPHCGLRVGTHITPRPPREKKKRGLRRSVVLPLATTFLIIGVAVVLSPFLQGQNRDAALQDIRNRAEAIQNPEEPLSDEELNNQINWLMATIGQFESRFPNDEEALAEFQEFRSALGIITMPPHMETLPDATFAPSEQQQQHIDWLIGIAQDHIIDISSYAVRPPDRDGNVGLDVSFVNQSSKDIARITFVFRALDGEGNPMRVENAEGEQVWFDRGAVSENIKGEASEDRTYLAVWNDSAVKSAELIDVRILYTDNSPMVFLPPAVTSALWPPQ